MEKIWNFIREEDGLELSEYAVIGGIIIGAGVAVYFALGGAIQNAMTEIITAVQGGS